MEEMDPCSETRQFSEKSAFRGRLKRHLTEDALHVTGSLKDVVLTGDLLSSKPDAKASLLAQPPTTAGATAGSARAPFMPFAADMRAGA